MNKVTPTTTDESIPAPAPAPTPAPAPSMDGKTIQKFKSDANAMYNCEVSRAAKDFKDIIIRVKREISSGKYFVVCAGIKYPDGFKVWLPMHDSAWSTAARANKRMKNIDYNKFNLPYGNGDKKDCILLGVEEVQGRDIVVQNLDYIDNDEMFDSRVTDEMANLWLRLYDTFRSDNYRPIAFNPNKKKKQVIDFE